MTKNKIKTQIVFGAIMIAFFLNNNICLAQHWITGGNGTGTIDAVTASNNQIGTDNTNNLAIDLVTYGVNRVHINGTGSSQDGFVGIGTTAPKNLLQVHVGTIQVTNGTTNANAGDGLLIGQSLSSSTTVEINNQENSDMRLLTGGTPRISIDHGSGGFVGVGANLTSPSSRLHVAQNTTAGNSTDDVWLQLTTHSTGAGTGDGLRIGVIDNNKNVEINQQEPTGDMLFKTAGSERARILTGGNVGIATSIPRQKLDVLDAGNPQLRLTYTDNNVYSDLQTNSSGYLYVNPSGSRTGINYPSPAYTLDVNGNIGMGTLASIYMRDNSNSAFRVFTVAGNASGANYGLNNVSVGEAAGPSSLSSFEQCVFVGLNAGLHNSGNYNTYLGSGAGTTTTSGIENVHLGYSAGGNMASGSYNFIGGAEAANHTSFSGDNNNIIGYHSGNDLNTSGADNNVLLGYASGAAITGGDNNVFVGENTAISPGGGANYRGAFGAEARADCDTCIGIGSYYHKVGVGTYTPNDSARLTVNATGGPRTFPYSAYFYGSTYLVGGSYQTSDQNLKTNIQPLVNASGILNNLHPSTFEYNTVSYPYMGLPSGTHAGLIAQQVEPLIHELVKTAYQNPIYDDNGNLLQAAMSVEALDYTGLIPYLIQGFKEQQALIDALQTQLNGCCPGNRTTGSTTNTNSIELENVAALQLLEADPNPFSESTMIKWNIPHEFQNAMLYFYDNSGNKINTYKINSKGVGQLQIFGSKLSSGIYTYTLIVDGKLIDSKKLVKSK